ncbi:(2Fe-2S) ferredoxin domain-containing protein [Marispirochaeta sp.]|jgi:NADP-reducing hydrogenase subunit HndB|uniref:(2Fe-2S) ferredoxin domain-containing protein n=1 Tax=Marispirochaeta sp. TaxID=2038653 RepID=UPI0029C6D27C|nr:(2Fe-2S) ferredoxin domain-containing protein [Marispirochaeta sp.]
MTLEELRTLREQKKKEMDRRDVSGKSIQIIVGGGTCGIAAGARKTHAAFLSELEDNNVTDVVVKQTGCLGLCHAEPTVEVIMPGMPTVIYGNVNDVVARKIVHKHIMANELVNDHIFDRPAVDIIEKGEK